MNMQDDFFNIVHRNDVVTSAITLVGFQDLMHILGLEISKEKTFKAATTQVILGLEIDTDRQVVTVPKARLDALKILLLDWEARESASKVELQSLIGVLIFCTYGVRWGRAFVRRLIDAMVTLSLQTDRIQLDEVTRGDIRWWIKFAPDWEGVTYMIDWRPIKLELHFYFDSSNPCCAGVWCDRWWFYNFTAKDDFNLPDISCKELFAVVTQCATFGPELQGSTILLFCDNSASVDAITTMKGKSRVMTSLVRELFYLCARYSFQVKARHVAGSSNQLADYLSRPALRPKAWSVRPSLERQPVPPVLPTLQW